MFTQITAKPEGVVYVDDMAEGLKINGPVSDYDWDNATVVVKVPVHSTATITAAEIEVPLGVLAHLIARSTGYRLVREDAPQESTKRGPDA